MLLLKKSLTAITIAFLSLSIISCGIYKRTDIKDVPVNVDDRVQKNIEEGRGVKFGDKRNKNKGGVASFASSNSMWKATLDVLDFMILSSADYGGGIIITDWYSDGSSKESIKITVRFLSDEIRADGLKITVHQKICDESKNCKISKITTDLANQLKLNILKKAVKIEKKLTKKKVSAFRKQFPKRQTPKKDK